MNDIGPMGLLLRQFYVGCKPMLASVPFYTQPDCSKSGYMFEIEYVVENTSTYHSITRFLMGIFGI